MELWSIGHSTHPLDRLVELLALHEVTLLADVRTVPRSRRHPHVATEALAASLPARGIAYRHLPRLGGWRRTAPDSPNGGWRNASFQGYADHALTAEFAAGLAELATQRRTAVMCSEAVWWRCHRRLIADRAAPHVVAAFAEVQPDGTVRYPPA